MQVNESWFSFRGKKLGPISAGFLALDAEVEVSIAGQKYIFECVKEESLSNQDGTKDVVYVLKLLHPL